MCAAVAGAAAGAEVAATEVLQIAEEESRSVLASLITQVIGILRQVVDAVLRVARSILAYASENPLAFTLLITNVMIWIA
jgi:hypothetical protein